MDQLLVLIKIDDFWNPQLHALLIFKLYLTNRVFYYISAGLDVSMMILTKIFQIKSMYSFFFESVYLNLLPTFLSEPAGFKHRWMLVRACLRAYVCMHLMLISTISA